jgi:deoxyhypusine synthase
MTASTVTAFIKTHFRHFNARVLLDAAEGYKRHLDDGGKMFVTLGGAMSTAEIGVSLAEMIRQDKVHGVSCTGANLEEDIFNLVGRDFYKSGPNYRTLGPEDDLALFANKYSRVTDTCIPHQIITDRLERPFLNVWLAAEAKGEHLFPYECVFRVLQSGDLKEHYRVPPGDSWVIAAMEKGLPIFVPAWEDSTLGNFYAAACIRGHIKHVDTVRSGIQTMMALADWYTQLSVQHSVGFFQIGGGVAGDFPICVVPMLREDLQRSNTPRWGYFCQIGDSTTSYGSYSGAPPNEKISWGKLDVNTPSYMIESDATIAAPLMFAYVLGW